MSCVRPELESIDTAPKDGDIIIVVHADLSGVEAIRFGERVADSQKGWFVSDYSDEFCAPEELASLCAGWFYPPEIAWPEGNEMLEVSQ